MRLIGVFTVVVAGLGSACVPGNSPIRIIEAWQTDTECSFDDKVGKIRGTLDASGAGTYVIGLDVDSDLVAPTTVASNGMELSAKGLNNFIVESTSMTYAAKDGMTGATVGGAFVSEQLPITFLIAPDSTKNQLITQILGPKAADKIRTVVTDPMQTVILTVGITLKGHLESGSSMSSNTWTFPITVTTTGQNCANGWAPTGPCGTGGGQDGTVVTCL